MADCDVVDHHGASWGDLVRLLQVLQSLLEVVGGDRNHGRVEELVPLVLGPVLAEGRGLVETGLGPCDVAWMEKASY